MKRKREPAGMPPEYVKGPGKKGELHPHWRKSFPDDEEDADGRGKVEEGLPGHGLWRRVPGFWQVLASEDGDVMQRGGSRLLAITRVKNTFYCITTCNGSAERIHILVCRAFHGRPNSDQSSVNHCGDVNLTPKERRSDNRSCNLEWSTTREQLNDRIRVGTTSTAEPCIVWRIQGYSKNGFVPKTVQGVMSPMSLPLRFRSSTEAAVHFGIPKSRTAILTAIFRGVSTRVSNEAGEWFTGSLVYDDADLEGECWKHWSPVLQVSNRGRIRTTKTNGEFGLKRFPEGKSGHLVVKTQEGNKGVHVLVGELFFVGPKPKNWQKWDHKDGDPTNNDIRNLRPVTNSDNGANRRGQKEFFIWRKETPEAKIFCNNVSKTANEYCLSIRGLRTVLHKIPHHYDGHLQYSVNGYCAAFCDEVE